VRFLNGQPLRRQIVVTTGALLLVLAGAIVWSANRTRAEREDEVRDEAMSIARLATGYLNQYFDGLDAMASVLVRHPAIAGFNRAEAERLFADLVREQPLLLAVVLRDRAGQLVASSTEGGVNRQAAPAPEYLSEVLRTGRPAVSALYAGPLTGQPTIGEAYPVAAADETIAGVLAFSLNVTRLQGLFESIELPDGSVVTLIDQLGQVVARSQDGARYLGKPAAQAAAEAPNAELPSLRRDIDGVDRFVGVIHLNRGPWALSVGIPREVVARRLTPLWWRTVAISGGGVFAVLALALWVSHHTSHGMNRLRSAAQQIAAGDLSPPARVDAPNRELAELQDAFITMAANLRTTHDALDRQVEQERRMREMLQSLQRQVVRQERLAAVGVLVSGVAHELNNPLQAILGTAELLEQHPGLPSDFIEEIGLLKTQSHRAREIIRNLSRFSSQQSGPPALVDLRTVVAEVVQLRRHDLEKSSISIDVVADAVASVYANMTELEQVTLNFVINAQQAIESSGRGHGRILIRLIDEGHKVKLEVQDDGPGVPADNEPKLFQPFFTTKPAGEGTGLGLSVSYGIIESYDGVIGHHGNEWHGATFFFELPAADAPPRGQADPTA